MEPKARGFGKGSEQQIMLQPWLCCILEWHEVCEPALEILLVLYKCLLSIQHFFIIFSVF